MQITENIVTFSFNGKSFQAIEGQTIAAALFANGIKKLGVSRKLQQPRGLFCSNGRCASCFVSANGMDHVLSCMSLIENGMIIQSNESDPDIRRKIDGD